MPGSILGIDNHLALAIDVAISSIYRQLHAWTWIIYVLIGPFMFWHKWSGGTILTQKWSRGTNYAKHKWSPQTTYGWTIYVVTGQLYNYIVDQPNTSLIYNGPKHYKLLLNIINFTG